MAGFYDYIQEKKPMDWSPDDRWAITWVEKDIRVHTPKGVQLMTIVYAITKYTPPYDELPVEVLEVYPVCQFDESYLPAPVLMGVADEKNLEWFWREYKSKHNHYHLLPKELQDQIYIVCMKAAEDHLDGISPEEWEPNY